ncbi:MAG TPA: hypothetical protein VK590_14920 [Saprospiraceae bacterium]|nr:hypothetical protein [Saprospiraceae bacterium]
MKTLLFILTCFISCDGYSQTKSEAPEDYINRLWQTADTNSLKNAFHYQIPEVKTEPTFFEQQLIFQKREHDHEWQIEALRMLYQDYYYQQYYFIRRY